MTKSVESDWSADPCSPLTAPLPRVLDAFDECALELALRLRDALAEQGVAVALCALTFGGGSGDHLFDQRLFALGFSAVTRIEGVSPLYDPRRKARLLADAARGADMVLCGMKSGRGGSGLTGSLVAAELSLPAIPEVCVIEAVAPDRLRVISEADGIRRTLLARLPLMLMIGSAENAWLRVPTLRARMAVGSRSVSLVPCEVLQDVLPLSVKRPRRKAACQYIDPNAPVCDAARALLTWLAADNEAPSAAAQTEVPLPKGLRLFGANPASLSAAAQLAAQTDAPLVPNLLRIEDGLLIRSLFAGALEAFVAPAPGMIATLDRRSKLCATEPVPPDAGSDAIVEVSSQICTEAETLGNAPCVLVAGYGLGSAAAVARAEALAKNLGLAFGATRPVVMSGWAAISKQVGVSGTPLHASRCLVLGASGADAFLAAVPDSCRLAAVNSDAHAPIFHAAALGIVGDALEILDALERCAP